ncbi:MAG: hypothetical protein GX256_06425 [Fretibacterium sp.]|nr:hypothetical protein [Fretibacterium sp.]
MSSGPRDDDVLRWYVGVPIGTNPLILMDFATVLVLVWAFAITAVVLLQLFFGHSLTGEHIQAAARLATRLVLLAAAGFAIISFLLLRNRYTALYRLDREGLYCENMRMGWGEGGLGELSKSFHWRPFAVPPLRDPAKSVTKKVPWRLVDKVLPLEGTRTLLFKSGRGTAARVYCPDDGTFERALRFARAHIPEDARSGPEKELQQS